MACSLTTESHYLIQHRQSVSTENARQQNQEKIETNLKKKKKYREIVIANVYHFVQSSIF